MKLDNFAARDQRLLKTVLGLRYETTPEQLRYVLAELRKLLLGHPKGNSGAQGRGRHETEIYAL
jgi:MscS family membrane protein